MTLDQFLEALRSLPYTWREVANHSFFALRTCEHGDCPISALARHRNLSTLPVNTLYYQYAEQLGIDEALADTIAHAADGYPEAIDLRLKLEKILL